MKFSKIWVLLAIVGAILIGWNVGEVFNPAPMITPPVEKPPMFVPVMMFFAGSMFLFAVGACINHRKYLAAAIFIVVAGYFFLVAWGMLNF